MISLYCSAAIHSDRADVDTRSACDRIVLIRIADRKDSMECRESVLFKLSSLYICELFLGIIDDRKASSFCFARFRYLVLAIIFLFQLDTGCCGF